MSTPAIDVLRALFKQSGEWLGGTMEGVTEEVIHFAPAGGLVAPIAGQVAHTITGLDYFIIKVVGGKPPLMMSSFADKTGLSEPPPQSGGWLEWASRVRVDEPVLSEYVKAVYAGVDEVLATLEDADLQREIETGFAGKQTIGWALNIAILDIYCHTGEVACLKGIQGLKGYPM